MKKNQYSKTIVILMATALIGVVLWSGISIKYTKIDFASPNAECLMVSLASTQELEQAFRSEAGMGCLSSQLKTKNPAELSAMTIGYLNEKLNVEACPDCKNKTDLFAVIVNIVTTWESAYRETNSGMTFNYQRHRPWMLSAIQSNDPMGEYVVNAVVKYGEFGDKEIVLRHFEQLSQGTKLGIVLSLALSCDQSSMKVLKRIQLENQTWWMQSSGALEKALTTKECLPR